MADVAPTTRPKHPKSLIPNSQAMPRQQGNKAVKQQPPLQGCKATTTSRQLDIQCQQEVLHTKCTSRIIM
eukprot:70599-Amphidinium_carterae.1